MTLSPTTNAESGVAVEADVVRNVLRTVFRGVIRPIHVAEAAERVQVEMSKLGAGFVLVTDLSELKSMELECFREVTRMMDLCFAAGLGKVIRIIPDPQKDIGFQMLALVHYRGKIPSMTCTMRAEAENELSRP